MVAAHGVDDLLLLSVALHQLHADLDVGALHLAVDGLADVMEEAGSAGEPGIRAHLAGHVFGNARHFLGVFQDILAVGGAIVQAPHQLVQLGVDVRETQLDAGGFANLLEVLVHVHLDLFDHLLDAGGMDAAVGQKLQDGLAGHLAADGVEA